MGYLAGFGPRDIRMTRAGFCRGNSFEAPIISFTQDLHEGNYQESWVEGMIVPHNRKAKAEFDPSLISGALHKRADENGDLDVIAPPFHPIVSRTSINMAEAEEG